MRIGLPKEIKQGEHRVGLTPESVQELSRQGHTLLVEAGAGHGIHAGDDTYEAAGARIVPTAAAVFEQAELVIKVKEPQKSELDLLRPQHTLFTYLHLAADRALTEGIIRTGCTAIAYECVPDAKGGWPLLKPMSEIAGRLAPQMGAMALHRHTGGAGVLLSGVPGVGRAHVTVIGGGHVGRNAAEIALGLGAYVTILDRSIDVLTELERTYDGALSTAMASPDNVRAAIAQSVMVIGAVMIPGRHAPTLLKRSDLPYMRAGSVLVDVAIDQGGCFETSRPTTHAAPTYEVDGIIHMCVANMPGAVPHTSTFALNACTMLYIEQLANLGTEAALEANANLRAGLNVRAGKVLHPAVIDEFGL